MQACWFFKYERDLTGEGAPESGVLHVFDGLRLSVPGDLATAALLGLAIKAKNQILALQQEIKLQIHALVQQAPGEQLSISWPAGPCLGMGSTSQVYTATVMGVPSAVKMPADPSADEPASTTAQSLERLQHDIAMMTGPLRHLQGTAVPMMLASGTLADPLGSRNPLM